MDSLYAFICLSKKGGISLNVTQIMAVAWGYNWCSNSIRVISLYVAIIIVFI